MAKKATVKKTGQKAAPKAGKITRPKKAVESPRPAKSAAPRPSSATAGKQAPSRSPNQPAKPSKLPVKTGPAKKAVREIVTSSQPRKPTLTKKATPEIKKAPVVKIEPADRAPGGNNRPRAGSSGVDGHGKAKPRPADGTASIRHAKPVRIDRRPVILELPPEIPPTYLTPAELEGFREMLLQKRHELIGDVANLEDGAIRSGGGQSTSGLSSMPIHMADIGSDTWEQELTLGLIENERGLLREIDEALERIKDRTYGMCLATGKPITKARLRAKPWAKYCIEYARKRELGLV
ncbi:MAG TPA: TraR/DksA C4-type zinc finger protein [Phycisphaerae bacterium]|nr:TraR/DksA C4-type zinc finger protein [Phycisphaerae bacterium]HRY69160.1 TraR/DksA C4-type zinc finger protein [Phycisphaerae bacterium]HSA26121.1 TraR/DksA C4-type zinc finger protein [Phycisphaerae bacterium]